MNNYSVLMSVYKKEKPEYLKISIESMMNQTIPTNDLVLMCDGPLTEELDQAIIELGKKYPALHVYRISENKGLGNALREGIIKCKNEIIARMDSDDYSVENRCEKQLEFLKKNKNIGIVGSNIAEFTNDVDLINCTRKVPEKNSDIIKFMSYRNPFNHPSVMYRKECVLKAGNYKDIRFMQDYFLWVDMISSNVEGYNIQENLVHMRADNDLYKRRSGKTYFKIQVKLLNYMKEKKIISNFSYIKSLILRTGSSFSPNFIRKILFKKYLRKEV